jgi:hypothetical protein
MGKSQGELKRERKAGITRRNFLKNLGIGLGMLGLLSAGYLTFSGGRKDERAFDFLRQEEPLLNSSWRDIIRNYVPLSSAVKLGPDCLPGIYKEFKESHKKNMEEEARRRGFTKATLDLSYQQFGRPEERRLAEGYKSYIERAREYLFSRLLMLERVPLELVILENGQDFSKVRSGLGFIGKSRHEAAIATVKDISGESFSLGKSWSNLGSHIQIGYNRLTDERDNYFLFFGTGENSLSGPFSESIHLATSLRTHKHEKHFQYGLGRDTEEAITEGIAHILGREFVKKEGISGGEEILEKELETQFKKPKYRLVGQSIDWLKRNGVEQGLALYMESPEKYLEAITEGK